jgi:predicted ATPase/serine/threonine protein kinase/DNA-binding CsgD family transcriptional regulator
MQHLQGGAIVAGSVREQLGNYHLIHVLGRGNFADVYLGQHIHLNTEAAIKVLHEQLADDDLSGFLSEARTIARLRHPHIIQVLDFGVEGTTPFLVMDYAPNGNLRQRYPQGTRLPLDTVVSHVKQAADALQYAHNERLVHCDIKPENMLLGRNDEVLLSDFGIAILAQIAGSQDAQQGQEIAGTVAYMAPEQFQAHPGPASDQYALGIVVYEWLCGDRPFHGAFPEIAVKHTLVPPPFLHERVPTIPPAVEEVVLRALAKDPQQRFARVQDFAVSLEEASRAEMSGRTHFVPASEHPDEAEQRRTNHLPTGTVTLLFTDIEKSTLLLQQLGSRYASVLTAYRDLLRTAVQQWHGHEVDMPGDSFFAVFARATDAVSAAAAAQRSLNTHAWPEGVAVRVRMGLHTGEPERSSAGYTGLDVHYAARLTSAAHGGQVLLSRTTQELVAHDLPEGVFLRDMGVYHLKDFRAPKRLFQLLIADLPADFPPLRTLDARFNNLPVQLTSLIGREQEVVAVCTLLQREDVRLVTLTGTGGIGKTRLSLAVATELLESFADGACFVPLASINDPTLVVPTIARLLGLEQTHTGAGSAQVDMEYLKAFLQEKHFLLVLDNFEQVVQAAPDLTELLVTCPHLTILVTSRAALHLQGEQEFPVPPLAFPRRIQFPASDDLVQYAAIILFLQRALAIKPDFALTKANILAISAICKHLDGLPLAIELAAARIKVLPPQALLQRLTHRLTVLTGGTQDAPARQQTLRNTIAWSYNLLDEAEQQLFRRLSVFVGGCTLEAIEAISDAFEQGAAQVLDGVASLIDKSLLQQSEQEGDEPRLAMLETIREFGLEYLTSSGEMEQTRQAHAEYYLHLAEESEAQLFGAEQERWFDRLEREHDNLRAALEWAVHQGEAGQRIELALRLGGALAEFWSVRGYINEGRPWLERALASSLGATVSIRAKALKDAAWLAVMQDDGSQAEKLYEESLRLYQEIGETRGMAWSLFWLGWLRNDYALLEESRVLSRSVGDKVTFAHAGVALGSMAFDQGDYAMARSLFEESVALFEEMGNKEDMAWALRNLGRVLFAQGDEARAYALAEESLALCRELHDKISSAYTLDLLGRFALSLGKVTTARSLLEEGLALFRELGTRRHVAQVLSHVASVAAMQGDDTVAHALYEESLVLFRYVGDTRGLACCLQGWGAMIARQGELTRAARLWGVAETLSAVSGPQRFSLPVEHTNYERADYERMVSIARTQLGEQAFAKAWAEGRTMTPEQALAKQGPETAHELAILAPQPARTAVPTPAYPNGLTAREVQVLRLVAKGLTNNEIAEELRLSEKTIAHHLTHIFNKTTSENRAAAAAFAIRHGLA